MLSYSVHPESVNDSLRVGQRGASGPQSGAAPRPGKPLGSFADRVLLQASDTAPLKARVGEILPTIGYIPDKIGISHYQPEFMIVGHVISFFYPDAS